MKLASFLYQGKRSYGIVQAEGVIDLGRRLGDRYGDLKALLQGNGLAQATRFLNDAVDVPLNAITFLPVIVQPEKILCVGMNYADKRKEFDQHNPAPTLFVRFPDSQTGHNEPVLKPRHSSEFDYEGELAVIIGKGGGEHQPRRRPAPRGGLQLLHGRLRPRLAAHLVHRREKLAADRGVRPVDGDGG